MEFSFTQEQNMIRDTAQAFLSDVSSSEAIRRAMETSQGFEKEIWQRICTEMYWQALHVPEEYGGLGLGYIELVAILEQMGKYLLCSPFFSTVCLGANALLIAGTPEQKQHYLSQICSGDLTATLAYSSNGLWDAGAIKSTVEVQDNQFILNGNYRYVIDGHTADLIIVAARSKGSLGENGISMFAIPANAPGITRTWLPTMDQTRKQSEIVLNNVTLTDEHLMGEVGKSWANLNKVIQLATIATAAEQVGGSQQVLDLTVAYTKERFQFGRAIASFQGVKHQAADMMLRTEIARSAVYYAACVADQAIEEGPLASELSEAASVAKSYCSEGYFKNAGDAIQLHGGVGFTWEYDVHLYFKRAKSSELLFGNAAFHREKVAKLLLD